MATGNPRDPIPIGREPEPDRPAYRLLPRFMYVPPSVERLLPQAATIEGTVLRVGGHRCDLATATAVRVRTALSALSWPMPPVPHGISHHFTLLEAWQDQAGPPVSLVVTGSRGLDTEWNLVRVEHLRLLARILADRTWQPGRTARKARHAITFLTRLADDIDRRDQPIDWSFRAGPMADRRRFPGQYD